MKKKNLLYTFLLPSLLLAGTAHADPCRTYSRTVNFGDGTSRQAQGTACQDEDGVWRVTQENLVPLAAPLPPEVYYGPPAYYPPPSYYYPRYYYDPFYYPYPYYYGPSLSFGFEFHDHDHGHWGGHHH